MTLRFPQVFSPGLYFTSQRKISRFLKAGFSKVLHVNVLFCHLGYQFVFLHSATVFSQYPYYTLCMYVFVSDSIILSPDFKEILLILNKIPLQFLSYDSLNLDAQ